jgi:ABC-type amino acid transport system permease subunit
MQASSNHIQVRYEQDNLNIVIYSSFNKQHLRTMGIRLISDLFAFLVGCFLFWMSLERNQAFRFELTILMMLLSTLYLIGACLIVVVYIFSFLGRVELVVDKEKFAIR